jgi:hypothetical protein
MGKALLAATVSVISLSACGGGSYGDDSGSGTTISMNGGVADGYLCGVTICLGTNRNAVCEADEQWIRPSRIYKTTFPV